MTFKNERKKKCVGNKFVWFRLARFRLGGQLTNDLTLFLCVACVLVIDSNAVAYRERESFFFCRIPTLRRGNKEVNINDGFLFYSKKSSDFVLFLRAEACNEYMYSSQAI